MKDINAEFEYFRDPSAKYPDVITVPHRFKKGSRVRVINDGLVYSTYDVMAKHLGVKKWENWKSWPSSEEDRKGVVLNVGQHLTNPTILYLVRGDSGKEYIIGEEGLIKEK